MDLSAVIDLVFQANSTYNFANPLDPEKVAEAAAKVPADTVEELLKHLGEQKDSVKDPTAWITNSLRKAASGRGAKRSHSMGPGASAWGGGPPQPGWAQNFGCGSSALMYGGDDGKVRKRVEWLNTQGGFGNSLNTTKVLQAASGADVQQVMKVLKVLEEEKDQVKDPTAYVTAGLRKLGGGQRGAGGGLSGAHPSMAWSDPAAVPAWTPDAQFEDTKLRKRIGWLNTQGGFDGAINYTKILSAAGGVEFSEIFEKLKFLEGKKGEVTDPTAWICTGLRKAAAKANTGGAHPPMAWPGLTATIAFTLDAQAEDAKLRKRIGWLNTQGGFDNAINYTKILSARGGVEFSEILEKLKFLEGKKGEVTDPTAWICAGLRKAAASVNTGGGSPPMAWSGPTAAPAFTLDAQSEDAKLRKRIGWLNTQGGFDNAINYTKILSARGNVEFSELFEKLKFLEGKKGEVTDPTAWICAGLRKAAAKVPALQKGGGSSKGSGKVGGCGVRKTMLK